MRLSLLPIESSPTTSSVNGKQKESGRRTVKEKGDSVGHDSENRYYRDIERFRVSRAVIIQRTDVHPLRVVAIMRM